jgi:thiamine transport system substrate-binding protein
MKTTFTPIVLILVTLASVLVSCSKEATRPLVIWTYDSFVSEWGPGTEIARRFKAETGLELTWEIHGDAGTLLSRLILEGKEAKADIILGLDQNMAEKALETGLLSAYKPENTAAVFP